PPSTPTPLLLPHTPLPPQPTSPLFPYTTLFRSQETGDQHTIDHVQCNHHEEAPGPYQAANLPGKGNRQGQPSHSSDFKSSHHPRSEEHTSELQSLRHLVCRLLLEKKKKTNKYMY